MSRRRQDSPKEVKSWRDIPTSQITEAWGGYNNFMLSYGLKMYNMDDMEEGRAIINAFKKVEFEQEYASKGGGSASTGSSPTGKPTAGKSTAGTSTKRSSKN